MGTTPGQRPDQRHKTLSLVLGSGGARGLAHIGVIRELEKRGYKIEAIAGCSMGALVGGLYAVGKLEEYASWVCELERSDILGLLDITGKPGGFISGNKVMAKLRHWLGDVQIEDLPIDYTAVAVDIEREREVWMSEGPLFDAIRASIAIPGAFTPHRYRDRVLVDGGVLNPIPVAPTVNTLTDQTFVVDANGPPTDIQPWLESKNIPRTTSEKHWLTKVIDSLGWGNGDSSVAQAKLDVLDVLMRSVDIMQAALTRQHLAVFHPDCVFRVPRNICMIHEFHRAKELIAIGEAIARQAMDDPEFEQRQWQ